LFVCLFVCFSCVFLTSLNHQPRQSQLLSIRFYSISLWDGTERSVLSIPDIPVLGLGLFGEYSGYHGDLPQSYAQLAPVNVALFGNRIFVHGVKLSILRCTCPVLESYILWQVALEEKQRGHREGGCVKAEIGVRQP
jgi:hypothetical protein